MKSNFRKIMLICLLLISGVPALFVGFVSSTQNSSGNEAFAQIRGLQGRYEFKYCICDGCGGVSGYPDRGGQCLTFGGECLFHATCG